MGEGTGTGAEVAAGPWPLTGRDAQLRELATALDEGTSALLLLGEAGTGKTRLATELVDRLAAAGWTTATALATSATQPVPLGALGHLVPTADAGSPSASVEALRRALGATARTPDGEPSRALLHVDDAHLLDPSSALVLVGLVASGAARLVLTARLGTTLPDALLALRSGPDTRSILVGDLADDETTELLAQVLGAVDGIAASQLRSLSGGNPLYLRELVLGGVAEGSLAPVAGVWQLRGPLPATDTLSERVHDRLAALGADARAALELLAVGEPLGLDVLEGLSSIEALDELERAGAIRVEVSRRRHDVRLAHPLYGEVLRADLDPAAATAAAARLAEAMAATGARRATDAGQLIRWQVIAGIPTDAERILRSAAVARHHDDWIGAARLARIAHDAGLADAANLLAEAHYALGEFEEGDAIAEPALAAAGHLSDEALTSLHRTRAGVWFFASRDPDDAEADVVAAEQRMTDPALRDMLRYARAAMCMWSGRVRDARQLAEPLLANDDPRVQVMAAIAWETVTSTAGPADAAIASCDRWYAVHAALPDLNGTNSPAFHLLIKTEALVNAGRFEEAAALASLGYQASVASLNRIAQMWFAREAGQAALGRGDAAGARRWLVEQTALCRGTAWHRPLALGLSHLAVAEALLGDAAAARQAIVERDALDVPVIGLFASEAARGTAWALAAEGDRHAARGVLVAGAAAAEEQGIELLGALARLDALRLGATDQAEALAAAAERAGSPLVGLGARWAAAARRGGPDGAAELDEVAIALEALGALLHAAEARTAAGGAWADAGDARRSTGSRRAGEALRTRAGGRTPDPDATPVVALTAREREVATLVAEGLPSKQVAERLFLSTRTVSNHLQNAYAKLGISGRAELPEALASLALSAEA